MASKIDFTAFEAELVDPSLGADRLREIVGQLGLKGKFKPGRIFPIGIVVPDGIRARVDIAPTDLQELTDNLVVNDVRSWRVFPIGIVAPDRFTVEIDMGRRFAAGGGG